MLSMLRTATCYEYCAVGPRPAIVTLVAGSKWRNLLIAGDDDEMFMTRSFNVTSKTTEQHLIVCSDKSVAYVSYVTNNTIRALGGALCNRTSYRKVDRPGKLPGPWTTTWSKQYLSAVHPVTCSLLWVRCLFDRVRKVFNFQIFRFRHPDYDPDRAQKLISSSMCRQLSTRKISSKSMHAFLSNLANRQTDKHCGQSHIPPPLSEVKKDCARRFVLLKLTILTDMKHRADSLWQQSYLLMTTRQQTTAQLIQVSFR